MKDYNKSKDQLIAELQQLRQKVEIIENKATLLRHNNFISNTKDHISFIDSKYLYFDVNQTYLKTHKLNREDVVGRFVEDIFGKEIFTSYIKENIDKCLTGEVIKYQKWFFFPKNKERYMDVAFYPFYDKKNNILGIMVSSHDITELKIKEEQLAIKEQKYATLIQNIPGMVYMGIQDRKIEFVDGAEDICAYSDKELHTGLLKWEDIIHPNDKERVLLETEKLFKKAQSKVCVYRIITKKEQIKWVEDRMTTFFYEQDGIFRIDGIVLDITERKIAEEVLKKSEERFRNLFTRVPIGLYRSNKEGRIIEANPAMVKMLDYPNRDALLDTNLRDIFVDSEIRERGLSAFDNSTIVSNNTFQLYRYDGKIITVHDKTRCVKNTEGKILYFEGSLEDITERKKVIQKLQKAKEKIEESEKKFRELFEKSGDAILIIENEKFIDCNQATVVMLQYDTKEKFLDAHPSKLSPEIQPDGRKSNEKADEMMETALKNGTHRFEWEHIRSNGEIIPVEVLLTAISNKPEKRIIHTVWRDITDRKKAEEILKQNEERLRLAQNAGRIGTWEWNVETDEIIWSDMTYQIFGLQKTKKSVTRNEYFNYIHQDDKQRLITEFDSALNNKKYEHRTEYRIIKNNEVSWIDETSKIITDKAGKLVKMIGILQDITERKKAEQALKESEAKLRESNLTKDKFFSIIAHDLKSPFNTMLGFSNLLVDKFDQYNTLEQKKFIDILNQDIQNTYELLENLLLWSRSQRGALDFNFEKENLYLLAVESFNLLNQSAVNKSITIINRIPENIYVYADKDMLATVIRNLISNAIKFTPQGGEIVLHACIKSDENKKKHVEISVSDNGIGIEKEKLDQLFKISENVSTKGTEGESGTGLGLILCKEFVEKHGGKIWVESEFSKSSKFIFTIPVV